MIKLLSNDTIQKIAAGEVIERPFSVVKELVENSIDSGATEIKVEISGGGLKYINVTDNGKGIPKSEVELAVKRHATSKLDNFNDLYKISSLGFRGEALASITSISKTTIETRTKEEIIGSRFIFEGSILKSSQDIGKNIGTSVIVRDLFYNIPVRKRFLNSTISESNMITSIMYRLAISNYNIGFTYIKDDKEVFRTIHNVGLKSNLSELFGFDFTKELIEVNLQEKNFNLKGYISNNRYYRSNKSMEFLYINNRYIKNSEISNVIEKSYGSLIPNGRFPAFQLFIEINPNLIDVNIHPNKEKVSIAIIDEIKESLNKYIPKILLENKNILNLRVKDEKEDITDLYDKDLKDILNKIGNYGDYISESSTKYYDDEVKKSIEESKINNFNNIDTVIPSTNVNNYDSFNSKSNSHEDNFDKNSEEIEIDTISYFNETSYKTKKYIYIGTIFKTYNIFQSQFENKVILMDQHAAHERINYEKFLKLYQNKEVIIQQLLDPILINVNNTEIRLFKDFSDLFYDLGFDVDIFSEDTLIVRGLPDILDLPKTKDLFLDILDNLNEDRSSFNNSQIVNKVISMSCKASIKSGDYMSEFELTTLLENLLDCENPLTCPHGRPTIIEINKDELEKLFLRLK